jgi:hypothetical protein
MSYLPPIALEFEITTVVGCSASSSLNDHCALDAHMLQKEHHCSPILSEYRL